MIVTRMKFSKLTKLSYNTVCILFDRLSITEIDDYKYSDIRYDVSWYDLQKMKDYLLNRKDKRHRNYNEQIAIIDKLCEEM